MNIKELRAAKNLSQKELAKLLDVSAGAIGHLENGRLKVSEKLAAKVKEVLGEEIDLPADVKAAVKETRPAKAAKPEKKLEIYIQSPLGGNITPEQIEAKLPKGVESVFVRVDQNKLWWIKGEETGSVDIW